MLAYGYVPATLIINIQTFSCLLLHAVPTALSHWRLQEGHSLQNVEKNCVKNSSCWGAKGTGDFQDGYADLPSRSKRRFLMRMAKVQIKSQQELMMRYPSLKGYIIVNTVHYVIHSVPRCVLGIHV